MTPATQALLAAVALFVMGVVSILGPLFIPGVRRWLARGFLPSSERARIDLVSEGGEWPCNGWRTSCEAIGQTYDYRKPGSRLTQTVVVPPGYDVRYDLRTGRRIIRVKDGEAEALPWQANGPRFGFLGADSATEVIRGRVAVEAHRSFRDDLSGKFKGLGLLLIVGGLLVVGVLAYQYFTNKPETTDGAPVSSAPALVVTHG